MTLIVLAPDVFGSLRFFSRVGRGPSAQGHSWGTPSNSSPACANSPLQGPSSSAAAASPPPSPSPSWTWPTWSSSPTPGCDTSRPQTPTPAPPTPPAWRSPMLAHLSKPAPRVSPISPSDSFAFFAAGAVGTVCRRPGG